MKRGRWWVGCIGAAVVLLGSACAGSPPRKRAPGTVRVVTYNLQWFTEDADPGRIAHVKSVVAHIDPDIVGLQEIESSRALRQVFDPSWQIGIADDPSERQELAVAVRRPFVLVSATLVFDTPRLDTAFPGNRDVLRCVVQSPESDPLVVYVVHMKSRRGGRKTTDPARETACGLLAAYIAGHADEPNAVVLGDFNDAPDDRSLNILESGHILAMAGPNPKGPLLLVNLAEPLADKDYATEGVYTLYAGRPRSAVVPGSKADNDRLRGRDYEFPRDARVPQTLFDQILVSPRLAASARAHVYEGTDAMEGRPGETRVEGETVSHPIKGDLASDHLPVWADVWLR